MQLSNITTLQATAHYVSFLDLMLNAANNIQAMEELTLARDGNMKTSTALASGCSEWELHPLPSKQIADKTTVNWYYLLIDNPVRKNRQGARKTRNSVKAWGAKHLERLSRKAVKSPLLAKPQSQLDMELSSLFLGVGPHGLQSCPQPHPPRVSMTLNSPLITRVLMCDLYSLLESKNKLQTC